MSQNRVRLAGAALFVSLVVLVGCGSSSPTAPTPVLATDTFTGTITTAGIQAFPFTVNYTNSGTDASITLTKVTSVATGTDKAITLGVAFGQVSGATCTASTSYTNSAATLNAELPTSGGVFGPGVYCVQVFDNPAASTVNEPINFTIIVKHY
jgi:hypothetical protein